MSETYNGPAFPVNELQQYPGSGIALQHFGLTLRDYFAAKAMQTLVGMETGNTFEGDADAAYEMAALRNSVWK